MNIRVLCNALAKIGYTNIVECNSGEHLLESIRKQRIDLIIVEKELPDMSATTVASEIEQSDALGDVSALIIGDQFTKEDVIEAIHRGIDGILVLPYTLDQLEEKIKSIR